MSHHPERPKLPLIAVHGETAANAEQRVTELLDTAGASLAEIRILIAAIKEGAVEGAHVEVIDLDTQPPSGSSDQVHEGWFRAVEAIAGSLAHIADRTLRQAQAAAAALETPSAAPSRTPHPLPTPVDSVGEEQVHRRLRAPCMCPEADPDKVGLITVASQQGRRVRRSGSIRRVGTSGVAWLYRFAGPGRQGHRAKDTKRFREGVHCPAERGEPHRGPGVAQAPWGRHT
jgi:hypothetical protein